MLALGRRQSFLPTKTKQKYSISERQAPSRKVSPSLTEVFIYLLLLIIQMREKSYVRLEGRACSTSLLNPDEKQNVMWAIHRSI